MTPHRFYCPNLVVGRAILEPQEAQHARRVLRLAMDAEVDLFDGAGATATGRIADTSRSTVTVEVAEVVRHPAPGGLRLEILTALPRAQRQQFIFEKCTELGVASIRPIVTERSTVKPQPGAIGKWRRLCIEAAKQSGCVYLPQVEPPMALIESFAAHGGDRLRFLATTAGDAVPFAEAVNACRDASRVAVWIGPEGGFTAEECAAAVEQQIVPVSLGPRVLRIETAAFAVAAWCALRSEKADNRQVGL